MGYDLVCRNAMFTFSPLSRSSCKCRHMGTFLSHLAWHISGFGQRLYFGTSCLRTHPRMEKKKTGRQLDITTRKNLYISSITSHKTMCVCHKCASCVKCTMRVPALCFLSRWMSGITFSVGACRVGLCVVQRLIMDARLFLVYVVYLS